MKKMTFVLTMAWLSGSLFSMTTLSAVQLAAQRQPDWRQQVSPHPAVRQQPHYQRPYVQPQQHQWHQQQWHGYPRNWYYYQHRDGRYYYQRHYYYYYPYYYYPYYYYPGYHHSYRWTCYLGNYWGQDYSYRQAKALVYRYCLNRTGSYAYCRWGRIYCRQR